MNVTVFFEALLSYLTIVPAAALCYFPMKNQLKIKPLVLLRFTLPLLAVSLTVLSLATCYFQTAPNTFLNPVLIAFFFCYHESLTVHISKSLAVYFLICTLMALVSNFANGFDAIMNPHSGANTFSMAGSLSQLAFSTIAALLLAFPFTRYGSIIIDRLHSPLVWYTTVFLSALFFSVNLLIRPLQYQTLYTNNVFLAFWGILTMMLSTLLTLTVIFYFIVSRLIKEMETEEKNRLLEMRESQYVKQQRYMEATAEERHNFRQTLRTLESLAREEDMTAIQQYLADYVSAMPKNDVVAFCANHAVNALLNYYAESAGSLKADMDWHIGLPKTIGIPDTDLCSVIGNLLENAIAACQTVPEESRFIDLSITLTEADTYLCIVMTNPYRGNLRRSGENYLSTRRNGSGIGLSSIRSIAEQYGGVANFSDQDGEFFSDVMLRPDPSLIPSARSHSPAGS